MQINQDWLELIKLFIKNKVQFVVVGGHAVSVYGFPRYTEDLDLFIESSTENACKILATLKEFFGKDMGFSEEQFIAPEKITMIGSPPFRIDIITSIAGITFKEVDLNKSYFSFGGINTPFIGIDDLLRNKKDAGRPKDLGDREELLKRKKYSKNK